MYIHMYMHMRVGCSHIATSYTYVGRLAWWML